MKKSRKLFLYFLPGLVLFSSCFKDENSPGYEFMPDMYRSPSYEVYDPNPNFENGMTARQPVPGTVSRTAAFFPYKATPEGYEAAGRELKSPLEETPEVVAEGKRLYGHFCIHCHGDKGMGDGSIVKNGKYPPPPAYSSDQLRNLPEGKAYFSIVYGKNLMGPHGQLLNHEERWKVVAYVKQLQAGGGEGVTTPADTTAPPANNSTTAAPDTTANL